MSCSASSCRAICPPSGAQVLSQKAFALTPGDAPTLQFAIINPDETPFNLADYNVSFVIKRSVQDTEAAAVFNAAFNTDINYRATPQDGLLDVQIPAAVTLAMRLHQPFPWFLRLAHQIQLDKIFVPARGTFLLQLPST